MREMDVGVETLGSCGVMIVGVEVSSVIEPEA